jgi:pimeloyl-ACP methyl ester carboxylesterase
LSHQKCRGEIILTQVSTTRHRAGAGEPLVLLHGIGESATGWRPVQEALSREYDVIALDFPGFGGSARLAAEILPNAVALADAVERETDQLGIGDFHVAGYSLGARVSPELATRGRIRSVVAIAPDGLGTPLERVDQATALMTGRRMAAALAPVATPLTASGPGRTLFFAMERSRPWNLTWQDARQLLTSCCGRDEAPSPHRRHPASLGQQLMRTRGGPGAGLLARAAGSHRRMPNEPGGAACHLMPSSC